MKKLLITSFIILASAASYGAITATSDDFSTNTNTFPSWSSVGTTAASITYIVSNERDWYDKNDSIYISDYAPGMEITGDGLLADGGLRIDTQNIVAGDETIGLTIGGTMEEGETITLTGNFHNENTSYTDMQAQLWNLTDGTMLAETAITRVKNYNNISYSPVDFTLLYTGQDTDDGDTLQIRFGEQASGSSSRDFFLDHFELTSVPQPPGTLIAISFDGDGASGNILGANTARWDYTARTAYDMNNATENTLAFNGKSTGTDYIIRDKGTGHETALYFKTINPHQADFGVYLLNMNFTFDGTNSTQAVRVNWSFDILGYNQNGGLNPANWTVKINTANDSPVVALADSSVSTLAQTFSFIADTTNETSTDGTWTTVTGSAAIPPGAAGTNGLIQISADNGAYTSSGGVFFDNLSVSVTNIPPVRRLIILSD